MNATTPKAPKLDGNKRTILRARVRRHPDAGHIIASLGLPADVSSLSTGDLSQVAQALGVTFPNDSSDYAYQAAKTAGQSAGFALQAADEMDGIANTAMPAPATSARTQTPGAAFAQTLPPNPGLFPADDAAPEDAPTVLTVAAEDAKRAANDAMLTPAGFAADDLPAKIEAAAQATLASTLGAFGRGDMAGFQSSLLALARATATAELTPPPVAQAAPAYVDPAKVKGTIPNLKGKATAKDVGAALQGVRADVALGRYDAADAPRVDADYCWPADAGLVVAYLAANRNVFLTGPAGTGKTTLAEQIAARWGRPFVRVSCDDQTEAATLVGMTVPKDGGVVWQDGILAGAIRRPGTVVLIDEPSVARPGALFVLQSVLDGARAITVQETGERIPVAPGVIILAADNTNGTGDQTGVYEGTRRLNRAFLSRFAATVPVDYLTPVQEAAVLHKRTGMAKPHAMSLAKFAALTRGAAGKGELSTGISYRALDALAVGIMAGGDPARVFGVSVLASAAYEDAEPLRQLWAAEIKPNTFN